MMDRFRADLKDDVERLVNKAPGYGSRLGCHWDDPMLIHSFNASCVLALKLAMLKGHIAEYGLSMLKSLRTVLTRG